MRSCRRGRRCRRRKGRQAVEKEAKGKKVEEEIEEEREGQWRRRGMQWREWRGRNRWRRNDIMLL